MPGSHVDKIARRLLGVATLIVGRLSCFAAIGVLQGKTSRTDTRHEMVVQNSSWWVHQSKQVMSGSLSNAALRVKLKPAGYFHDGKLRRRGRKKRWK